MILIFFKIMKFFFFLTFFLLNVSFLFSQNKEIFGIIIDENGNNIRFAKISIMNGDSIGASDNNGEYRIFAPIDVLLTVRKDNLQANFTVFSYSESEMNIILSPKVDIFALSLEELAKVEVITAGRVGQQISQAPAIISVITAEQIRESGYRSVAEALQSIPGMDFITDHLHSNVGIRGVNGGMNAWSRIIKVMIDGQSVAFRSSGENWLDKELIPLSMIQRIEIVRGPSSALYGANAFLGVVNIITKTGNAMNGGLISAKTGFINNNFYYGGEIAFGKKIKNFDFILSFAKFIEDRSGLEIQNMPGKTFYKDSLKSKNDISVPRSIFAKMSYNSAVVGQISLDFNYQISDSYGEFQEWGILTHKNRIALYNFYVRGSFQKTFSKKITNSASLVYSHGMSLPSEKLDINETGIADFVTRKYGYDGIDFTYETRYNVSGRNFITIGFDYNQDKENLQTFYKNFANKPKIPMSGELNDTLFTNIGIYFQSILYPFDFINKDIPLGITFGFRYDINNIYGNVPNFRAATVYQFNENIFAKLLYGTSFKAPAATQLYTTVVAPNEAVGNPKLKPEEAKTCEMQIGTNCTKHFEFTFTGFYNIITNKVELLKNPNVTSNVYPDNVDKISSYGTEISLVYLSKKNRLFLNFSYQKSTFERNDFMWGKITSDTRLYPQMLVKSGFNRKFPKLFLNLFLDATWTDQRLASDQNTFLFDPIYKKPYFLESYFLLNFHISTLNFKPFRSKETIFSVKIENLLDTEYCFPGFKNYDVPSIRRSFHFSITQHF